MATYVDFHVIQTVPPSCINRDDTGSPKSAMYGGVRRHRVSSQAWKRATRLEFNKFAPKEAAGIRTKRVIDCVAEAIKEKRSDLAENASALAKAVLDAGGVKWAKKSQKDEENAGNPDSSYLWFVSRLQITALADLAIASSDSGEKVSAKEAKAALKSMNSYDLALFGRMVADDKDMNVDAACQVAHAISTHAAEQEFDYFTAVDDVKSADSEADAGAGMIGTVEFTSSTLYRYATVNLDALEESLGDAESACRAVQAFGQAFIASMPTGKQNTFANRTLPEAVYVAIRSDQPVSLVQAFEKPVMAKHGQGYSQESIKKLAQCEKDLEGAYGVTPERGFVISLNVEVPEFLALGEKISFAELGDKLAEALSTDTGQLNAEVTQ